MRFDIITLFPEAFSYLDLSVVGRARRNNLFELQIHNLRDFGIGKRKNVDDKPFGGGAGMVLMIEPIYFCLKSIGAYPKDGRTAVILTSAKGEVFNQSISRSLLEFDRIIIIAGHYEGVDERVAMYLCDLEISIGRFVLSGGELPAMVILDSVVRNIDGVLGNVNSLVEESFSDSNFAEYPQYTRPSTFETEEGDQWSVPDNLLSGNHAEISKWRESLRKG